MSLRIRLIWRMPLSDAEGRFVNYHYRSDIVTIPKDAAGLKFPNEPLPELIGGEWLSGEWEPTDKAKEADNG